MSDHKRFQRNSNLNRSFKQYLKPNNAEKAIQNAFTPINLYLWLHGIGFTQGISCKGNKVFITLTSIILLIIMEGNFLLMAHEYLKDIHELGIKQAKGKSVTFLMAIIIFVLRCCMYTKRKLLNESLRKLERIFVKICCARKKIMKIKIKLIILFICHESYQVLLLIHYFNAVKPELKSNRYFGWVPPPFAIPSFYVSSTLQFFYNIGPAVAAYSCLLCLSLKEMLIEVKRRVLNDQSLKFLLLYSEITNAIQYLNNLLHPFLLLTLILILSAVFRDFYLATFLFSGNNIVYGYFSALFGLSDLIIICISSSSVVNAVEEVKGVAKALKIDVSRPQSLSLMLGINGVNGVFSGFKILDSIVIDSSLILTAIGSLITYGMIIATFTANKKSSDVN